MNRTEPPYRHSQIKLYIISIIKIQLKQEPIEHFSTRVNILFLDVLLRNKPFFQTMGVRNYHTNSFLLTDNPKTILKLKEQPYLFRGTLLIHQKDSLVHSYPKWIILTNGFQHLNRDFSPTTTSTHSVKDNQLQVLSTHTHLPYPKYSIKINTLFKIRFCSSTSTHNIGSPRS